MIKWKHVLHASCAFGHSFFSIMNTIPSWTLISTNFFNPFHSFCTLRSNKDEEPKKEWKISRTMVDILFSFWIPKELESWLVLPKFSFPPTLFLKMHLNSMTTWLTTSRFLFISCPSYSIPSPSLLLSWSLLLGTTTTSSSILTTSLSRRQWKFFPFSVPSQTSDSIFYSFMTTKSISHRPYFHSFSFPLYYNLWSFLSLSLSRKILTQEECSLDTII